MRGLPEVKSISFEECICDQYHLMVLHAYKIALNLRQLGTKKWAIVNQAIDIQLFGIEINEKLIESSSQCNCGMSPLLSNALGKFLDLYNYIELLKAAFHKNELLSNLLEKKLLEVASEFFVKQSSSCRWDNYCSARANGLIKSIGYAIESKPFSNSELLQFKSQLLIACENFDDDDNKSFGLLVEVVNLWESDS